MIRRTLAALLLVALTPTAGHATSGYGCYRVNTPPSDPLNIRAQPSARSSVVAVANSANAPIIALLGVGRGEGIEPTLDDVRTTESAVCTPHNVALGSRWCPVAVYAGGGSVEGWLKRRFVDYSECP